MSDHETARVWHKGLETKIELVPGNYRVTIEGEWVATFFYKPSKFCIHSLIDDLLNRELITSARTGPTPPNGHTPDLIR